MGDELNELFKSDFAPGPVLQQRLAGHVLDRLLIHEFIVEELLFEDESESQEQIWVVELEVFVPVVGSEEELGFLL